MVAQSTGACTDPAKLVTGFGEGGHWVPTPLYVLSFAAFKGSDALALSSH